ncbi:butyrophilin-like protein 1 [Dicentrarchus labrax]|uniref:Ig-like domain-containing protein n=1 Tax=Dicentrarchus labrax TaxID=13489 RepID=A0A8P4K6L2_DICLA|nr:butyrophilin-like protein 1 [Dicentrarchus labrax]
MFHPQRKTMDLLPLVCLCLLTWSAGTAADHSPVVVKVEQGSYVILPCSLSTQQSITFEHFEWKKDGQKDVFFYDGGKHSNNDHKGQDEQFKCRVSHFEDQLKNGNASIKINNTKISDSGNYTCDFPDLQPRQTFYIKLVVFGAAAKPSVRVVKTDDGVQLQCEVEGVSPQPKVEWKDSAGNILPAKEPQVTERGGSYNVILQATVTKADNFTCVVTQNDINHQISAETVAAPLNESTGWIVGAVFITLIVVGVILAVLVWKGCIKLNFKKGSCQQSTL